ncbi:MAG: hypothetical protein ACOY30_12605 [Bacillota bacterium]
MSEPSGENLSLAVERLITKMERMYERQAAENDRVERMMSSLDSLSKVLARMESSKNLEDDIYKRIDMMNQSLERILSIQESPSDNKEGEEKTMDKVIQGVKTFGQVMSAVATGIQMVVDNVGTIMKKDSGTGAVADKVQVAKTQADLSMLLLPLSTLVKNLVDEKIKQKETDINKIDAAGQLKVLSGNEGDMS